MCSLVQAWLGQAALRLERPARRGGAASGQGPHHIAHASEARRQGVDVLVGDLELDQGPVERASRLARAGAGLIPGGGEPAYPGYLAQQPAAGRVVVGAGRFLLGARVLEVGNGNLAGAQRRREFKHPAQPRRRAEHGRNSVVARRLDTPCEADLLLAREHPGSTDLAQIEPEGISGVRLGLGRRRRCRRLGGRLGVEDGLDVEAYLVTSRQLVCKSGSVSIRHARVPGRGSHGHWRIGNCEQYERD